MNLIVLGAPTFEVSRGHRRSGAVWDVLLSCFPFRKPASQPFVCQTIAAVVVSKYNIWMTNECVLNYVIMQWLSRSLVFTKHSINEMSSEYEAICICWNGLCLAFTIIVTPFTANYYFVLSLHSVQAISKVRGKIRNKEYAVALKYVITLHTNVIGAWNIFTIYFENNAGSTCYHSSVLNIFIWP